MIWHQFQRPTTVTLESETASDTYGRFVAQPFERGWGTTMGNALRRSLLSSIPGAAVTAIKIEGVDHEFSALPGVVEDVTDIILNLKQVPIRLHGVDSAFITLEVDGPGNVTSGMMKGSAQVEVVDPDVHIATLSADAVFRMTVRVGVGRGYVQADENQTEDLDLGFIPVDSASSPVIKANFRVEMARVGQKTNFDKLIVEVWTDGTVKPEEAVSQAAQLVRGHMDIYAALALEEEVEFVAEPEPEPEEESELDKSIDTLELSIRSMNCLKNANIKSLRDLVSRSEKEMVEIRNFGEKSLKEVRAKLEAMGFGFGIDA
ncbi:MAG: DNA-directed RNA polymerase subunit alpha [Acidobacteriota bacterium]